MRSMQTMHEGRSNATDHHPSPIGAGTKAAASREWIEDSAARRARPTRHRPMKVTRGHLRPHLDSFSTLVTTVFEAEVLRLDSVRR